MAQKKALTDEELFAQFEDIPSETPTASSNSSVRTAKPTKATAEVPDTEDDPLAELSALAAARPASRPSTPRLSSSTTSGTTRRVETPSSSGPPSGRTSEDRLRASGGASARKSTESTRSYHQSYSASVEDVPERPQQQYQTKPESPRSPEPQVAAGGGGGGWWGSVFTAATAAVKQAEAAVKEIRGNEEAIRWAEQVKGNVETLKGIGRHTHSMSLYLATNEISRRQCPLTSNAHLHHSPPNHCASHLRARTPANSHDPRYPILPFHGSSHLCSLRTRNVTSRRW